MTANLNTLRAQIQEDLRSRGLVIFHGFLGSTSQQPCAFWDTAEHPDHREFIAAAETLGVRVMTMTSGEFSAQDVDDALEMLEESPLEPDEARGIETRLRQMRAYDGFTCSLELTFDHAGRCYLFELSTEWHEEFNELRERIEESYSEIEDDEDEDGEGPSLGGYYSRN